MEQNNLTNNENILSEETIGFIKKCYIHLNQSRQGVWAFADLAEIVWNPKLQKKNKELYFSIIHDAIAYEIIKYEEILEMSELKNDFLAFYSKFVSKINTSHEYTNFLEDRITTLENRFGLVWKEQEEQLLKIVSEEEIVLGVGKFLINKDYEFVSESKDKKKKIIKNKDGIQFTLTRKRGDSFLYFCKELNQLFLLYSVKSKVNVYSFVENHYTKYYPILVKKGENFGFGENRDNLLIEGDNYFALQLLQFTHREKIDVIYIDPPYNTGNGDFKYNDSYVGSDDGSRHSKWLSFMDKRLKLAKNLLSNNGVIFISIDENEISHIKNLCDHIFGEANYIENFIWVKNSIKNNSTTSSCNHEYILCYAKNVKLLVKEKTVFKEKKPGFEIINNLYVEMRQLNKSNEEIEKQISFVYKKNKNLKGISQYKYVDDRGIYRISDISAPGGEGGDYDIIHPNGNPCKKSSRGWGYSQDTILEHIKNDLIYFGKDEKTIPQYKRYLSTVEEQTVKSVIENFDEGERELKSIFNKKPFNNPKPVSLICSILNMVCDTDNIVLDFFAGSGTTGQAVIELNKKYNKKISYILCTNNESNICEDVTYSRLERIHNPLKFNLEIESLPHGLEYLQIKHISDLELEDADDFGNFEYVKQINNVKFNSTKTIFEDEFKYITDTYSVFKKSNKNKQKEYCDFFDLSLNNNVLNLVFVSSDRTEYDYFKKVIYDHISILKENPLFEKIKYYQMSKDYMDNMLSIINGEEEIDVEKYMNDEDSQESGE